MKFALRRNDDGHEFNTVRTIAAAGIEKADPFAPEDDQSDEAEADTSFDFGANTPKEPASPSSDQNLFRDDSSSDGPYRGGDRR